jgi:hypothetical protein
MSEDLKFPNAIAVNRNLIATLIDALVEEGALSPATRDRIIENTLGAIVPYPDELVMNTADDFVSGIFQKGRDMGLMGTASIPSPPMKPVCPSCGVNITPGHKFCTSCGANL